VRRGRRSGRRSAYEPATAPLPPAQVATADERNQERIGMGRRRIRWRWWGKWGCTAAFLLSAAAFIASVRWWVGGGTTSQYWFVLGGGRFGMGYARFMRPHGLGVRMNYWHRPSWLGTFSSRPYGWDLYVPLWLPTALFGTAGAAAHVLDRRRCGTGSC